MEESVRVVADFMNADTNVRNALINNIMNVGENGLSDMGYEISKFIMLKTGINLSQKQVASALEKPYEFGFYRYMGEYDQSKLEPEELFNQDSQIDGRSVDKAIDRTRRVTNMVQDLDCRDHHIPNCWQDFAGRGYEAIRNEIGKTYGREAVEKFEYYGFYDVRDMLKAGIGETLTKVSDKSFEELQNLNVTSRKIEEEAVKTAANNQSSYRSSLASAFK